MRNNRSTRRQFLKRTSTAAAAVAAPTILPSCALGRAGHVAPSNRIVMGCIGVGSQGTSNMEGFLKFPEAKIVAVCDVDRAHRENAKGIVDKAYGNSDCAAYNDFRELLERRDLDAISLAVPDHWHSIPSIAAANKRLDIYGEKPLALTLTESRMIVEAVQKNKIVWQTGSWQRSQSHFRRGCELVRNGRIGEVHTVKVGLPTGSSIGPQPEMPVPEGFDYNFWLGPAPWAPYTEKRCHWNWRWILDYSGGQLTDWIGHHGDIANWGMGTEHTGPISVEGRGIFPKEGLWNTATSYLLECIYPPGASPVAPKGFKMLVSNLFPMGTRFEGEEGTVFVDRGNRFVTDPPSLKDSEIKPEEIHLYRSDNHAKNFFDCVRSRELTVAPVVPAHRAISIGLIGNISMLLERKVAWDPQAESFPNDSEAAGMMLRTPREPWKYA